MAYVTLSDLKGHLDIDLSSDDPLLQEAIDDAQSYIESQTNRKFEASTDTREYGRSARDRWNSRLLNLYQDDLLTVTGLANGDSDGTAIALTDFWSVTGSGWDVDRNQGPPYHGILLKTDISSYWEWDTDYWVAVTGTWGYSATPPSDIHRATLVLASYFFRAKDSQVFETTAILESGMLAVPQGIPATVTRIINRYKRRI